MGLHLEVELARGAPAAHLGVVVLVVADRAVLARDVGDGVGERLELLLNVLELGVEALDFVADLAHAGLGGFRLVLLALLHHGADLLGRRVALRLEGFGLLDQVAPEGVEFFESVVVPLCVAVCESGLDDIGVLADKANVEHLSSRAKNRAFGD